MCGVNKSDLLACATSRPPTGAAAHTAAGGIKVIVFKHETRIVSAPKRVHDRTADCPLRRHKRRRAAFDPAVATKES